MIEDQQLTIAGTLGGDPELRFTPSGAAVVNFSVAVNPRYFDKQANEWREKGTDWWRCNAWRQMAENIAESFRKGDRVIVVGKVASRQFDTRDGQRVTTWELTVEDAGPSTKFATTTSRKAERNQQGQQQGGQSQGQYGGRGQAVPPRADNRDAYAPKDDPWDQPYQDQPNYGRSAPPQAEDPWASTPPSTGGGFLDEPPF